MSQSNRSRVPDQIFIQRMLFNQSMQQDGKISMQSLLQAIQKSDDKTQYSSIELAIKSELKKQLDHIIQANPTLRGRIESYVGVNADTEFIMTELFRKRNGLIEQAKGLALKAAANKAIDTVAENLYARLEKTDKEAITLDLYKKEVAATFKISEILYGLDDQKTLGTEQEETYSIYELFSQPTNQLDSKSAAKQDDETKLEELRTFLTTVNEQIAKGNAVQENRQKKKSKLEQKVKTLEAKITPYIFATSELTEARKKLYEVTQKIEHTGEFLKLCETQKVATEKELTTLEEDLAAIRINPQEQGILRRFLTILGFKQSSPTTQHIEKGKGNIFIRLLKAILSFFKTNRGEPKNDAASTPSNELNSEKANQRKMIITGNRRNIQESTNENTKSP